MQKKKGVYPGPNCDFPFRRAEGDNNPFFAAASTFFAACVAFFFSSASTSSLFLSLFVSASVVALVLFVSAAKRFASSCAARDFAADRTGSVLFGVNNVRLMSGLDELNLYLPLLFGGNSNVLFRAGRDE